MPRRCVCLTTPEHPNSIRPRKGSWVTDAFFQRASIAEKWAASLVLFKSNESFPRTIGTEENNGPRARRTGKWQRARSTKGSSSKQETRHKQRAELLIAHNNMLLCSAARRQKRASAHKKRDKRIGRHIYLFYWAKSCSGEETIIYPGRSFLPTSTHLSSRFSLYIWSGAYTAAFYALGSSLLHSHTPPRVYELFNIYCAPLKPILYGHCLALNSVAQGGFKGAAAARARTDDSRSPQPKCAAFNNHIYDIVLSNALSRRPL